MLLRKTLTPGSAPGGHVWETPDDVVEVDDDLALELLGIPDAGFAVAAAPEPADKTTSPTGETADGQDAEPQTPATDTPTPADTPAAETANTAGRRARKTTDPQAPAA